MDRDKTSIGSNYLTNATVPEIHVTHAHTGGDHVSSAHHGPRVRAPGQNKLETEVSSRTRRKEGAGGAPDPAGIEQSLCDLESFNAKIIMESCVLRFVRVILFD